MLNLDRILPVRELWMLEDMGYGDFAIEAVSISPGFKKLIRSKILKHRDKQVVKAVLDLDNLKIVFVFAKNSPRGKTKGGLDS